MMNNIPSFFHTPYEPGISLREDIFNRQFIAEVMGSVEYLEDDRNYGSFYRTESLQISGGATIAEIIDRLMVINRSDSWPIRDEEADYYDPELGHDCGPQSFYPGQIRILDRFGRLVIGGVFAGEGILWTPPVSSDAEANQLYSQCEELRKEAAIEASWDNYSTAERMRDKANTLLLADVDRHWRQYPEVLALAS
ncbi:hypothetical protein F9U39_19880 [Pectobacterium versatile]|uniref:Uncharacterized protein n=2 Tax=Pectobacterium TaxID=122277 RepID=A0AAW3SYA0_9GAMM|nr:MULTISPECIES: hypothetical protein [Pectobacterium]MBA5206051.1 hypothetical protein [Pectobacterium aroidearum]MBN3180244.1 hypothetical protein [Pectobacterium parmentieri]MBQ4791686.1 hypothetical protein [Pectobacterium versatile]QHQ23457.1 hypothetical protein GMX10_04735 [Pectobacterium parvum]QRN28985.1 hypothetical protein IG623_16865 [Pectobacterium parmentieri]